MLHQSTPWLKGPPVFPYQERTDLDTSGSKNQHTTSVMIPITVPELQLVLTFYSCRVSRVYILGFSPPYKSLSQFLTSDLR